MGSGSADMKLISKHNKGIRFLLYAIDFFSKYTQLVSLKDKKDILTNKDFQKIFNKSSLKSKNIFNISHNF